MKKRIFIVLLVIGISSSIFTGCSGVVSNDDIESNRFKLISTERYGYIYYDSQTNVEYWVSHRGYAKGILTMLVDENGNPLIYSGDN